MNGMKNQMSTSIPISKHNDDGRQGGNRVTFTDPVLDPDPVTIDPVPDPDLRPNLDPVPDPDPAKKAGS